MISNALLDLSHGISIENCEGGLLITQGKRRFVARRFKLTEEFRALVGTAVALGFTKLWQCGNPIGQESGRITFSSSHAARSWVFALGREARPPRLEWLIFPRQFRHAFVELSNCEWIQQSWGRREILVNPRDLPAAIESIRELKVDRQRLIASRQNRQ